MRNIIIHQLAALICFWLLFLGLQNPTIYRNSLGLVSDNWQNKDGERTLVDKPYEKLTNDNFIQWDAQHYLQIKKHGYNTEKAGGDYIFAFFPLFPTIWKISHLPPIGILFLNYLFFSASVIILIRLFSEKKKYVLNVIISLCLPGIIIFFIPYTEATFMLMTSIGIYGFVKRKYWVFFIGFLLASLARPSYTFLLLSIIGVEIFFFLKHKDFKALISNTLLRIAPLICGTMIVSLIHLSQNSGSLFKFIEVQKLWDNILAVPHYLRDWSHEGFAINVGIIFLIFIPILVSFVQLLYFQIVNSTRSVTLDYKSPKDYLLILSMIYLMGNSLFIILFRGGSLHCLFRFTLCAPFFFILLYTAHDYVKLIPLIYRFFFIGALSCVSVFVLGLAEYSTYWDFSDLGLFVLISTLLFWIFQDFNENIVYKTGAYLLLATNLVWTTFLFNTYIINGWIFA